MDWLYYTVAHGNGNPTERARVVVGGNRGAAKVAGASVLHAAECAAGRRRLRSVCRRQVHQVLRAGDGTAEPRARSVLPVAAGRLLRWDRLGTRDWLARDRLVGGPQFSAAAGGPAAPGSFDDFSDAARHRPPGPPPP